MRFCPVELGLQGAQSSGFVKRFIARWGSPQRRATTGPSTIVSYQSRTIAIRCLPCPVAGRLEHAQQMAGHESPRTTKLYNRTKGEITLSEVERIRLLPSIHMLCCIGASAQRAPRSRYAFDADYADGGRPDFEQKRQCIASPPRRRRNPSPQI